MTEQPTKTGTLSSSSDPVAAAFRADMNDRSVSLHERIYRVVRLVPPGFVTTYGDVGRVMGFVGLARQVGWALSALNAANPDHETVPWQRVINRHGMVSFRGDLERARRQMQLLEAEGLSFDAEGRCDLEAHRWFYEGLLEP